jgi:hypothetical protein
MVWKRKNFLPLLGTEPQSIQLIALSVYQLSYIGSRLSVRCHVMYLNFIAYATKLENLTKKISVNLSGYLLPVIKGCFSGI